MDMERWSYSAGYRKSVKSSNLFSWNVIGREYFGDGFTETLETKELDNLMDYVIRYINSLDLVDSVLFKCSKINSNKLKELMNGS